MKLDDTLRALIDPVLERRGSGWIECRDRAGCVFLTFTPEAPDVAKLIGKQGSNYETLKTLLEPVAWADGKMVKFSILDTTGLRLPFLRVPERPDWKPDEVKRVVGTYMASIGQPASVEAFREGDRWRFVAAGRLKSKVAEALQRWVSIIGLSTGGKALLASESIAV